MGKKRPNGYWTIERSMEMVRTCESRSEAAQKYPGAVAVLKRHGLLQEAFKDLPSKHESWTLDKCVALIRKCGARNVFNSKFPGAWEYLKRNDLLEKAFESANMPKQRTDWNEELALEAASKYETFAEFSRKEAGALNFLRKNGLVDKAQKMLRGPFRWTKEHARSISAKYDNYTEFKRKEQNAYRAILANAWKDELCAHMSQYNFGRKYDTKEACAEVAKQYKTRMEFNRGCSRAYTSARKHGWLDEICAHMQSRQYTKEQCHEEALKHTKRSAFEKATPHLYNCALKHKWMDEICSHMPPKKTQRASFCEWTDELAEYYAKQCTMKKEIDERYPGLKHYARKRGIWNKITAHIKPAGNSYRRCVYAVEFPDHSVYIGLTYNTTERWRCERTDPTETVCKYMQESGLEPTFKVVHDYTDKDTAAELEGITLEEYKANGWKILNKAVTGSCGGRLGKYTLEAVLAVARTCKDHKEFNDKHYAVYSAAQKYGWREEVNKILPVKRQLWTRKELEDLVAQYKDRTRTDFWRENKGAYKAAKKMGIYEELMKDIPAKNQYAKKGER